MNIEASTLLFALLGIVLGSLATWAWVYKSAQRQATLQSETQAKAHAVDMEHLRKGHALELSKLRLEHQGALSVAMGEAARSQEARLTNERNLLGERHDSQIKALESRHEEQMRKVESPLTVVVHPFVDAAEDKGLFKKSTTVEVGYKYQLMVQGIPCMEPHRMVVETHTTTEIDADAIKAFGEKAIALAEAAVQIKGGPAAGTLFSVAKNVVLGRKKI